MVQLAAVYENIKAAGAALWAIAPQSQELNQGLRERRQLPFPILADDRQQVIRQWGLFNDLDPKQRPIPYPATYLIGPNGRVAWYRLGLDTRDRPTPAELIAAVHEI